MERSEASGIFKAHCPIARTARRTKSTSISEAYLSSTLSPKSILFEFHQQLVHILVICEFYHDIQFFVFQIVGVVKSAALVVSVYFNSLSYKDSPFLTEDIWLLHQNQTDISQCNILNFRSRRDHGDCHISNRYWGFIPNGGPIFFINDLCISTPTVFRFNIITFMAAMTTLAF